MDPFSLSKAEPSRRVTLTKQQIAVQHDRCCLALFDAGINPFLTAFFKTVDGLKQRVIRRTYTHDSGEENFTFSRSRNWNSLPRVDANKGDKIAAALRTILEKEPGAWMGVVTFGAPCPVNQVGERRRELMNKIRRFMVQQRRFHKVDHFFSVAHESVRDRKSGVLRVNAEGELLYHVHVHFLFYPPPKGKKRERFIARLAKNFGCGSGVDKIDSEMGTITYLTAVQDRNDLLDYGEFVDWHKQTWRTARFRFYGDRKPLSRRPCSENNCTRPTMSIPTIAGENQFVGKRYIGKKCFAIWDNVTEPTDDLYKKQRVDREPDLS